MTVLTVIGILAIAVGIFVLIAMVFDAAEATAEKSAEEVLDEEYRAARCAMNAAAGQPWRNIVE